MKGGKLFDVGVLDYKKESDYDNGKQPQNKKFYKIAVRPPSNISSWAKEDAKFNGFFLEHKDHELGFSAKKRGGRFRLYQWDIEQEIDDFVF